MRKKIEKIATVFFGSLILFTFVLGVFWFLKENGFLTSFFPAVEGEQAQRNESAVAGLSFVEGNVGYLKNEVQDWSIAERGVILKEGDRIKTSSGSRAIIEFETVSQFEKDILRMDENSEVRLITLHKDYILVEQTQGRSFSRLVKSPERGYIIQSLDLRIIAQGTAFDLETDEIFKKSRIKAIEGKIEIEVMFRGRKSGEELLAQGEYISKKEGEGFEEKRTIAKEELENDWFYWNKLQEKEGRSLGILELIVLPQKEEGIAFSDFSELTVEKLSGEIMLSWDAYEGEDFMFYKIIRSFLNPNPTYPNDGFIYYYTDPYMTNHRDRDVQSGKKAYYRVCVISDKEEVLACSDVVEVEMSDSTSVKKDDLDLDLSLEAQEEGVLLSWTRFNNEEDFRFYKIVRSLTNPKLRYPDDGYIEVISDIGKTSYLDPGTEKQTFYYYRICVVYDEQVDCGNVQSITAINENLPPSASSLKADIFESGIRLIWSENHDPDFDYYKLVHSVDNPDLKYPEDGWIKAETDSQKTFFTDTGKKMGSRKEEIDLKAGVHYYRICVVDKTYKTTCGNVVKILNGQIAD